MTEVATGLETAPIAPPATASFVAASHQRLLSLDALRGFTMFWITGGKELVLALVAWFCPAWLHFAKYQLNHPEWKGFTAWDMIMPMFLFMVGVAIPFSLYKRIEQRQPLWPTYLRIIRRVVVLWVLGMIFQYGRYDIAVPELYSNTLQAIAIGYLVTSLAVLHLPLVGQASLFVTFVAGYWALLTFVPFGNYPAGTIERTANFALYVDGFVLDVFRREHDFTWVVTSIGFSATVLLGAMAGHLFRAKITPLRRISSLLLLAAVFMTAGWCWSYWLPLNRHLWTSSTILWAGGWSFLLVALLHAVIDVAGIWRWAFPFVVIGANALLAYLLDPAFDRFNEFLDGSLPAMYVQPYRDVLVASYEIVILWLVLWWLYRQRMFFRA